MGVDITGFLYYCAANKYNMPSCLRWLMRAASLLAVPYSAAGCRPLCGVRLVASPRKRGPCSAAHAALQSLMESAKVPACSRMGAIWPVFSAYLNAVYGTLCWARMACSIGRSSKAGSQNDGAANTTPSAPFDFTWCSRYLPLSSFFSSYLDAVDAERWRKALDNSS